MSGKRERVVLGVRQASERLARECGYDPSDREWERVLEMLDRRARLAKDESSKLAEFIIREVPDEPSVKDESPTDCAIRVMRKWKKDLDYVRQWVRSRCEELGA
jgi:hypothetical protein